MSDNGKRPEKVPDHIEVSVEMDLGKQLVTFTEGKVNGIIMIEPKKISVPLQTVMVLGAQATLAMCGVNPGGSSTQHKPAEAPVIMGREKLQ